jgi:hypothetical protein
MKEHNTLWEFNRILKIVTITVKNASWNVTTKV